MRLASVGAVLACAGMACGQEWVSVVGSPAKVAWWTENHRPMQAIKLDGVNEAARGPISYRLLLRYAEFDPMKGEPAVDPALAAPEGSRLRIVQFNTQFIEAYEDALRAAGVTVHWFLGEHAFIASVSDAAAVERARSLPFVRWVGAFHPAYKLEEPLVDVARSAPDSGGAHRYNLLTIERGEAAKAAVGAKITELGGTVDKAIPQGYLMEVTLTPAQLAAAARLDGVLWIDRWLEPASYMDKVRIVGGANAVEAAGGYTGAGVRGEVMDSELRTTHADFQAIPPIRHGVVGSISASHGTSVYGIVFGTGATNPMGRGMIPAAQGIFASYSTLVNRYLHTQQLLSPPYEAVFQTNSWGSCCTTAYGGPAADADTMLFDNQIVLLQAQANNGNTSSDAIAFAKNLISVGAVRHQDSLSLTDDFHGGAAGSTGPASDGRIKPDLGFWYDAIFTTSSTNNTSYTSGFGGTSAATPMTAGHVGLMHQMWSAGIFGNAVTPGASVFANRPRMSTAKALMINTASPYPFTGAMADLRRVRQGWGRADVSRMYNQRGSMIVVNEADALTNLQTKTYRATVPAGSPEFRATMVYTDPAGTANSTRHRVNDLTLKVTSPAGTVYWGNNGMLEGNTTTAGGAANIVDTVENVWVASPAAGQWTIEVIASEIVREALVSTPAMDATFGLVISGVTPCRVDFNADGQVDFNDYLEFLNLYNAGSSRADLNGDGFPDFNDYLEFLNLYNAGC